MYILRHCERLKFQRFHHFSLSDPAVVRMKDYTLLLYIVNRVQKPVVIFWTMQNEDYVNEIASGERKMLEIRVKAMRPPGNQVPNDI